MTHQPITDHELMCEGKTPNRKKRRTWVVEVDGKLYNCKFDEKLLTASAIMHQDGTISLPFLLPAADVVVLVNELNDEAGPKGIYSWVRL